MTPLVMNLPDVKPISDFSSVTKGADLRTNGKRTVEHGYSLELGICSERILLTFGTRLKYVAMETFNLPQHSRILSLKVPESVIGLFCVSRCVDVLNVHDFPRGIAAAVPRLLHLLRSLIPAQVF